MSSDQGVESGVQQILDRVKKGINVDVTKDNFRWAKEIGISTHAHLMLGMPAETLETIKETVQFVKEIDPTTATFGICTPYPGTPLFEEVAIVHPEIEDGTSSDLSKLHTEGLFNEIYTSVSEEELKRAVKRAYRSFYLRPSYLIKALKRINNRDELKKVVIAGMKVLDFSVRGE